MSSCHDRHMPGQTDGTAHDRPQRETDRPRPRHDHRRTDKPQARHVTTTCTSCAHVAHGDRRHRHMHTHDRTCAHKYHTTRHTSTHTPRGRGYPRDKSKAAGPLVLPLNAPQTIFELRVTHEIFTRIGYATVVAPVGVSRIHLG